MPYKIWSDESLCIGCGACTQVCDNWTWKDEAKTKAKPVKEIVSELGCNEDAERICPVNCIHHEELGVVKAPALIKPAVKKALKKPAKKKAAKKPAKKKLAKKPLKKKALKKKVKKKPAAKKKTVKKKR